MTRDCSIQLEISITIWNAAAQLRKYLSRINCYTSCRSISLCDFKSGNKLVKIQCRVAARCVNHLDCSKIVEVKCLASIGICIATFHLGNNCEPGVTCFAFQWAFFMSVDY